ncbi:2OG-Fe(II) oxygenase [Capsaspora owczarzaki ATCC 30864]|uniref:2OG-Fe(II) oxygenase n=1 Tax=Capsaspora owczarzaki (strain ATCC 30864) TaxID=595528 RepID=A0A0D2UHQ9_CAPO3|nr:2OG-Fe(II) oxygenase [Capsaspora owczarzaki ATCC 30864]KJE94611.1 2OG-Fe(II) oxygenase [Capsaspora owczarzaki ATCC 30864]|eukprot:XP_004346916.2 2OG-Fe(II) oxygenase [Capsaspora owczarzaki ATCC 30864]
MGDPYAVDASSLRTNLPAAVEDERLAVPVIDIAALAPGAPAADRQRVIEQLRFACRDVGFFYCAGHGVPQQLLDALFSTTLDFLAKPTEYKQRIAMSNSRVFRGWFALGGELTSYRADWKEGIYFGEDLADNHPDVLAKKPMHGANQWPDVQDFPEYKQTVTTYMSVMTELGHTIMEGIAESLGLAPDFFRKAFTANPFTPFRLFHYPADPVAKHENGEERWGVGVHRDYGCLTVLSSPNIIGLEIELKTGEWVKARQIPGTFVVNIGDMLEVWTKGVVRAAPHRVKNVSNVNRITAPFFFDPNFDCMINPLDITFSDDGKTATAVTAKDTDLSSLTTNPSIRSLTFPLRYGDYILKKVQNNFPELEQMSLK